MRAALKERQTPGSPDALPWPRSKDANGSKRPTSSSEDPTRPMKTMAADIFTLDEDVTGQADLERSVGRPVNEVGLVPDAPKSPIGTGEGGGQTTEVPFELDEEEHETLEVRR